MKIPLLSLLVLFVFWQNTTAQHIETADEDSASIENLFLRQLTAFPQEKIYVQTDKSTYVTGETLWMRIHLVDAVLLRQANASRYTYIELVNPWGHVTERLMIRPDSLGHFYGHLPVDETLPEGVYTLRAYTWFMQNQGEDYFFRKAIRVIDPMSAEISPAITFSSDDKKISAEIRFEKTANNEKVTPQECRILFDEDGLDGEGEQLSFDADGISRHSFSVKDANHPGTILLKASYNGRIYHRFFHIPVPDNAYHVSFFPEGGHSPVSAEIQMAFKALSANGLSESVSGIVYDDTGAECATFESEHLGMGSFRMYYRPERTYHAVCVNKKNVSKRFDLPLASPDAVSLKTLWSRDYLRVTLAKAPDLILPSQTRLIAHIRGVVLYSEPWNNTPGYVTFEKDFFPAGIVHFLLVDGKRNILSERLVFSSQKSTFTHVNVAADKANYKSREKIDLTVTVADENGSPLAGNFSLAVVDKQDVALDTISNILSTLLLTSELKGYIESPMSYLKPDDRKATQALDILMMTQGWRRYDIPALLKGKPVAALKYPVESSRLITGNVSGVFSSTKDGDISLIAMRDSLIGTSLTQSDLNGRFEFRDIEYPDSTWYIVQAMTKKGSQKVFVELDPMPAFPSLNLPPVRLSQENGKQLAKDAYVQKSNDKYAIEQGMRVVNLAEVEIVASAGRKGKLATSSPYYSVSVSKVITEDEIAKSNLFSIYDLLRRLPGVTVTGETVTYRGAVPAVILDNVPRDEFDYNNLNVSDVGDIFYSPPATIASILGARGANGAIVINTKKGFVERNTLNKNMGTIRPIGYQQTVDFYSPAYETEVERNKTAPDFRSTIYWKPNGIVDDTGKAIFTFYAADSASEYGVVVEGVSSAGHLIYSSTGVISRE